MEFFGNMSELETLIVLLRNSIKAEFIIPKRTMATWKFSS